MRLALAGPMGAGKTTVGRLFATRRGLPFVDLDLALGDVAAIWASEGEAGFRSRERVLLARLVQGEGVLALGGGTLVDPRNRAVLEGWPIVVLTAPLGVLRARIGEGAGRPLAGDLARLLEDRGPIWRAAGAQLDTEGRSPEAVVDALEAMCALV